MADDNVMQMLLDAIEMNRALFDKAVAMHGRVPVSGDLLAIVRAICIGGAEKFGRDVYLLTLRVLWALATFCENASLDTLIGATPRPATIRECPSSAASASVCAEFMEELVQADTTLEEWQLPDMRGACPELGRLVNHMHLSCPNPRVCAAATIYMAALNDRYVSISGLLNYIRRADREWRLRFYCRVADFFESPLYTYFGILQLWTQNVLQVDYCDIIALARELHRPSDVMWDFKLESAGEACFIRLRHHLGRHMHKRRIAHTAEMLEMLGISDTVGRESCAIFA